MIEGLTLHQLQCFDAVVAEGGFQPAAEKLRRTQPTVFAAVKNLEAQLGLTLLDRSGYRVALTDAGRSFHDRARVFLQELRGLQNHARQLAMGEESELRVVIGDLCPVREVLALLRAFFDRHPGTRLHLHVEAIAGPWERLFDGEADLIIHHIDKADPRLEFIDLCAVKLIPVVAPGFLRMPISEEITPEQMRGYVQCVIRDARRRQHGRAAEPDPPRIQRGRRTALLRRHPDRGGRRRRASGTSESRGRRSEGADRPDRQSAVARRLYRSLACSVGRHPPHPGYV